MQTCVIKWLQLVILSLADKQTDTLVGLLSRRVLPPSDNFILWGKGMMGGVGKKQILVAGENLRWPALQTGRQVQVL